MVLSHYNFGAALTLDVGDRLRRAVSEAESRLARAASIDDADPPPIPPMGATETEIAGLEVELGFALPGDYRTLLRRWRYLDFGTGCNVWGFGYNGSSIGRPWLSTEHRPPYRYLVFGDYWAYGDGDQLLLDLNDPDTPVALYLHDHRGRIEYFAPTISLAVWRMVFEELA